MDVVDAILRLTVVNDNEPVNAEQYQAQRYEFILTEMGAQFAGALGADEKSEIHITDAKSRKKQAQEQFLQSIKDVLPLDEFTRLIDNMKSENGDDDMYL